MYLSVRQSLIQSITRQSENYHSMKWCAFGKRWNHQLDRGFFCLCFRGEFVYFSDITVKHMNVFPWNFQDRSDMSQGTIGSIVDGSDLVRLFHDSLATRGGGLRSRIASCFIPCTLCNWYSSHVDFFSFYVSFAVINSPWNRGIYIISACEMVNRSYRKWLAGFWPRRPRWNNVQSQFVDSTVFLYNF